MMLSGAPRRPRSPLLISDDTAAGWLHDLCRRPSSRPLATYFTAQYFLTYAAAGPRAHDAASVCHGPAGTTDSIDHAVLSGLAPTRIRCGFIPCSPRAQAVLTGRAPNFEAACSHVVGLPAQRHCEQWILHRCNNGGSGQKNACNTMDCQPAIWFCFWTPGGGATDCSVSRCACSPINEKVVMLRGCPGRLLVPRPVGFHRSTSDEAHPVTKLTLTTSLGGR